MGEIRAFLNKVWALLRVDGLLHLLVCAEIVQVFAAFAPFWVGVIVAACAAAGKEVYDLLSKRGTAEWHDIACDGIGILLGTIVSLINLI